MTTDVERAVIAKLGIDLPTYNYVALSLNTWEGAGVVLEAMRERGWEYELYSQNGPVAFFWKRSDEKDGGDGPTLPAAVLKACATALKIT